MTEHSAPERPVASPLTNPRADRVRQVARLAGRSARRRSGQFLVEGPQSVREALLAHLGRGPAAAETLWRAGAVLDQLYYSARLVERDPEWGRLVAQARATSAAGSPGLRLRVQEADDAVLTAMSDAQTAQGIIAVAQQPAPRSLEDVLAHDARLVAVLCRIQDPGNAGTILRAADAAGADAVVLLEDSVDPFNPKVVRSTAGSLFHLPVVVGAELEPTARLMRARGLQVWAAAGEASDTVASLPAEALRAPTAWLFGNEAHGLSEQERASADRAVAVPLYGAAESLNVGTAATVCLYSSAMTQHPS
ncbi:MAG: RNA methyltransferase [Micrococcus sp.]|nr:RNA methyltransferase [Micrococcus sp.]